MAIEVIDTEKFKKEIFDFTNEKDFEFTKDKPIILNFFATWCGPCHAFAPALESVAEEHKESFSVFKIDIDKDPEIPALFGVRGVPTTVFFVPNDQPVLVSGNIGRDGLDRAIDDLFKAPKPS